MNDTEALVQQLEKYNQAYRSGNPLISDAEYDLLVEKLHRLDPLHPFLSTVEPEKFSTRKEIRHPSPMLSLEKAYTDQQLERFLVRIQKEANNRGIDEKLIYKATPKLDGLAGRDDGKTFTSRGNGIVGYEISSAFEKGIVAIGGRGQGLGEIVAVKSYFDNYLADSFVHPRNMVVGIISSDTLNEDARKALDAGQVHFVPYSQLPSWQGPGDVLLQEMDLIADQLQVQADYPMDGIVVEVLHDELRSVLGATAHHYRWQIAVKRKGDTAETVVEGVQWQVGRTGNITPVLEVIPVSLSGATISRVTAHHAGMITKLNIGKGAVIEIIRSGEVIPKLEQVLTPAQEISVPESCPACNQPLSWKGDFLRCTNSDCPAQREQRISHWFRTLGNADWYGIKTIEKLVNNGYDSLEKIYAMQEEDFLKLGFGPVQSRNLAEALLISRTKPVEDWRFLAAFGVPDLGVGDSRKLLQYVSLESLEEVTADTISKINGFGDITSQSIAAGLNAIRNTYQHMLSLGFAIEKTPLITGQPAIMSAISGKKIVFSGKMVQGSREEMQDQARRLGAVVQSAVSSGTDLLVCGEKVGQAKLQKASALGVQLLMEEDYYCLINGSDKV